MAIRQTSMSTKSLGSVLLYVLWILVVISILAFKLTSSSRVVTLNHSAVSTQLKNQMQISSATQFAIFKIISNQCSSLDLFPTVVELSGLSTQKYCSGLSGTSLVKFIDNPEPKNRLIFSETGGLGGPWPSPKKHNIFCVRSNDSKLIYNDTSQTWEFYDLKQDPDEKNNIYSENLEIITKLKNHLVHHLKILNKDTKLI